MVVRTLWPCRQLAIPLVSQSVLLLHKASVASVLSRACRRPPVETLRWCSVSGGRKGYGTARGLVCSQAPTSQTFSCPSCMRFVLRHDQQDSSLVLLVQIGHSEPSSPSAHSLLATSAGGRPPDQKQRPRDVPFRERLGACGRRPACPSASSTAELWLSWEG